jgi:bifunctional polynucleotide phosphatase/kinase
MDGTIIRTKSGKKHAKDIHDWVFYPNIIKSLKNFTATHDTDYLFIVSNQGGISEKIVKYQDMVDKFDAITSLLSKHLPSVFVSYMFATSNSTNNSMRKPNTGMFRELIQAYDLKKVPTTKMLMIGDASGYLGKDPDRTDDIKAADNFLIDYMDVDDFISKYSGL